MDYAGCIALLSHASSATRAPTRHHESPQAQQNDKHKRDRQKAEKMQTRMPKMHHDAAQNIETGSQQPVVTSSTSAKQRHSQLFRIEEAEEQNAFELYLGDMPTLIRRPRCPNSLRHVHSEDLIKFDAQSSTFQPTSSNLTISPRLSFESAMLLGYAIQPYVQFPKLGFRTNSRFRSNLLNEATALFEQNLDASQKLYVTIKFKSIGIIKQVCEGNLTKAQELLESLADQARQCEPSEFTAWFHIATFWLQLKKMVAMNKSDVYCKSDELLATLRSAAEAFRVDASHRCSLEESLCLWWMFLVEANLMLYALGVTEQLTDSASAVTSRRVDYDRATRMLEAFLQRKRCIRSYPMENSQLDKILSDFDDLRAKSTESGSSSAATAFVDEGGASKDEQGAANFYDDQIDDIFHEFISKSNGFVPECVQRADVDRHDGKIHIYTTATSGDDFKRFLQRFNYNESKRYFEIELCEPIELFINSAPHTTMTQSMYVLADHSCIDRPTVAVGGVVTAVKMPDDQTPDDQRHKWTLGLPLRDKLNNQVYIHTTAHSVADSACRRLSFRTCQNGIEVEICTGNHIGYVGGSDYGISAEHDTKYCHIGYEYNHRSVDKPKPSRQEPSLFIDALLLPVSRRFLQEHPDMFLQDINGLPCDVDIYEGDMNELIGLHVIMMGMASGRQEGIIVHVDGLSAFQYRHFWHKIGFFVALKDENGCGINQEKMLAQKGDSGAPIVALHPVTGKMLFLGSVISGNTEEQSIQSSAGAIKYKNLTYCTDMQSAKQYFHDVHGLDLECYKQESRNSIDSGYSTAATSSHEGPLSPEPTPSTYEGPSQPASTSSSNEGRPLYDHPQRKLLLAPDSEVNTADNTKAWLANQAEVHESSARPPSSNSSQAPPRARPGLVRRGSGGSGQTRSFQVEHVAAAPAETSCFPMRRVLGLSDIRKIPQKLFTKKRLSCDRAVKSVGDLPECDEHYYSTVSSTSTGGSHASSLRVSLTGRQRHASVTSLASRQESLGDWSASDIDRGSLQTVDSKDSDVKPSDSHPQVTTGVAPGDLNPRVTAEYERTFTV